MPKTIEERVYELMCAGCEKEHYCHNACETCDEYADEVERLYDEQLKERLNEPDSRLPDEVKLSQEEKEQFWEEK